jgi:8-oxo-dGTP pyrophosphatase MutT (NUDIX family)
MTADPFDIDVFLGLSAARLAAEPPSPSSPLANLRGDHDLDGDIPGGEIPVGEIPGGERPPAVNGADARPAAVLIPVVRHAEPTVLLTQRSSALRNHAGQIAFPGGKVDRVDGSPLVTALRETEEEIGLPRERVRPLGYLDPYLAGSGFRIVPVVGLVEPGFTLAINPAEVDDAFEVPLSFLMNPGNHQLHSKEFRGAQRSYYAMPFAERYIWGATAGMLRNFYRFLSA